MASSMQEYLKRYASDVDDKSQGKKRKKKTKTKSEASMGKRLGIGLSIVDADPVWQKELKEESSESEDEQEDAPLIIKDVEFQRLQRLEALRSRPYLAMADDGSGWVEVKENQKGEYSRSQKELASTKESKDVSHPTCHAQEGDVDLTPERGEQHIVSKKERHEADLSPSRLLHNVDLSPIRRRDFCDTQERDFSPPRLRHDTPERDLLPPKQHHATPERGVSIPRRRYNVDLSPKRTKFRHDSPEGDLSPPRKRHASSKLGQHDSDDTDLSPIRRCHNVDLSPKRTKFRHDSPEGDLSPPRKRQASSKLGQHDSDDTDLSPIRRSGKQRSIEKSGKQKVMADGTAAGLKSGRQLADEIDRKKLDDSRRYKELDASITGRHANTVYRDKHGRKLESFEEMLKLQQGGEPMKEEKVLEWGQGLVQKREAEARLAELEAEKSKPFARTRDDPELDKHLREQVRWGDPMAHLVKNKATEPVLEDLGAREQMQESGFVVPQAVPKHSWLKRGITPPSNRYGIKPGRHWDGVDRSTGFERDMFKRQNEKAAERLEAYLWSVADM